MSDAPNAMENIENCNDPEDKSDGEINDSSLHLLHPEDRAENNEIELNHCVNSVLDFTLQCVQMGEYSKAVAAMMDVIGMCDAESIEYRLSLLWCVQIFYITRNFEAAIECMLTLYLSMPPPYTTSDGMMILGHVYDQQGAETFAAYWYKKCFSILSLDSPNFVLAWQKLAEKAFDHNDFILSKIAYEKVLHHAKLLQLNCVSYHFGFQYMRSILSVYELRADRLQYQQESAYNLAITMKSWGAQLTLTERIFDPDYINIRNLYWGAFPTIYEALFTSEDIMVCRISKTWRISCTRRKRAATLQSFIQPSIKIKKKKPSSKDNSHHQHSQKQSPSLDSSAMKTKTKARIQSFRNVHLQHETKESPNKASSKANNLGDSKSSFQVRTSTPPSFAVPTPIRHIPILKKSNMEHSPTRRKLNAVRNMRNNPTLDELPISIHASSRSEKELELELETLITSDTSTLLEMYPFPQVTENSQRFIEEVGRPPGAGDLDLSEIETFARMALYRSRVIKKSHLQVNLLDERRVKPKWLQKLDKLMEWIIDHQEKQTDPVHFTEIHSRVLFKLLNIHKVYEEKHGRTIFTEKLTICTKKVKDWKFGEVEEILLLFRQIREVGFQEESNRNLEFHHIHKSANSKEKNTN